MNDDIRVTGTLHKMLVLNAVAFTRGETYPGAPHERGDRGGVSPAEFTSAGRRGARAPLSFQ